MRNIVLASLVGLLLAAGAAIAFLPGEGPVVPGPQAVALPDRPPVKVIRPDEAATRPGLHAPVIDVQAPMSPRCSTPAGVCLVPPQPVGSPCTCGDVAGTVIP